VNCGHGNIHTDFGVFKRRLDNITAVIPGGSQTIIQREDHMTGVCCDN